MERNILTIRNFTTLNMKANVLRAAGKTAEADKITNDALTVATENELNAYGYQLLNDNQADRAIEVFVTNTQKHPKSANTFDSLGEAYVTKGDKKNAILSFKRSLTLNPTQATKQNSEKFLKQLGAM